MRASDKALLCLALVGAGIGTGGCSAGRKAQKSPSPPSAASSTAQLLRVARQYVGVPYRVGGTDRRGMDCSGFTQRVYQEAVGIALPRTADAQAQQGRPVQGQPKPGDLVFFREAKGKKVSHVGIVSEVRGEEVRFLHASTSKGVREDSLKDPYWKARYAGARRLIGETPSAKAAPRSGPREK